MLSKKYLLILMLSCLMGCAQTQYKADDAVAKQALPNGATNVKDVGNNWITFQWNNGGKNQCFLYHKEKEGILEYKVGFESIAPIDCK